MKTKSIDEFQKVDENVLFFSSSNLPQRDPNVSFAEHFNVSSVGLIPEDSRHQIGEMDEFFAVFYRLVVPFLVGLISILGTVGNGLVIHVIISRSRFKSARNVLLLNLAFADLCFLVLLPPFTVLRLVSPHWPFGEFGCKLSNYLINVVSYVTVYTLVIIAVVRYMTLVHSKRTVHLRTRRNASIAIATIWLVMFTVNAPIITSYVVRDDVDGYLRCEHDTLQAGQRIFGVFFVFAYLLPLAIVLVLSVSMFRYISDRHRPGFYVAEKSSTRVRLAGRLLLLVAVLFAVLWLPMHVNLLVVYFGKTPPGRAHEMLHLLGNWMAYFNSCINPVIYNHTSKDFRKDLRETLCCKRKRQLILGSQCV